MADALGINHEGGVGFIGDKAIEALRVLYARLFKAQDALRVIESHVCIGGAWEAVSSMRNIARAAREAKP
jgi:hypothetical protein